jgi:predicted Holliday junction resolvase-like endonuclease
MEELLTHPTVIVFAISSFVAIVINYAIIKTTMANIMKTVEQLQRDLEEEKKKETEIEKMMLKEYLRKEDFLAFQNKVEARMEMRLEKLEEKIEKLLHKLEAKQ